jgi:hypothetical protein
MSLPTGLRRDSSGIFHLRIGIPDDVRPYWLPKPNGRPATDAFRRCLRTANRAEAITQAHRLIAEHQEKFAALPHMLVEGIARKPEALQHVAEGRYFGMTVVEL